MLCCVWLIAAPAHPGLDALNLSLPAAPVPHERAIAMPANDWGIAADRLGVVDGGRPQLR